MKNQKKTNAAKQAKKVDAKKECQVHVSSRGAGVLLSR